jgi:ParB family chromosome partitioning protein
MDTQTPRRGLGALLQSTSTAPAPGSRPEPAASSSAVAIALVRPNPHQPRKSFNDEALSELSDSIKSKGIIQPIVVRVLQPNEATDGQKYEIIAGERRYRAAQRAGLTEIPIVITSVSGATDVLLLSLIENLQRDDLNPLEESEAYKRLNDFYSLTQEQVASAVGKSRTYVTNAIRLLELPEQVKSSLRDGRISVGHAKLILSIEGDATRIKIARRCEEDGLTVRQLEALLADGGLETKVTKKKPSRPAHLKDIEARLSEHLGTKVKVDEGSRKGKIVIEFYSVQDFDRITSKMGLTKP